MAEGAGLDRAGLLAALARHGAVVRVVVAAFDGSSPREVGAAMLVWETGQGGQAGQSGTIGGGALEFQAAERARAMLRQGRRLACDRIPLGPALGQCCGGAVTLVSEIFKAGDALPVDIFLRQVSGAADMPLALRRRLAAARGQGTRPLPQLVQGWFIEPVVRAERQIWIWGAGHVGRALVDVLAPLPGLAITWVDTASDRFPDAVPAGVTVLPAADPARLVAHAPRHAEHLVLTYSHALDLELCHRLLAHGFAHLGLIGSE
ncbi:MAG: xanthine dehydrogenase accessory protein XdhC, partial [Gemmobacter sp.]